MKNFKKMLFVVGFLSLASLSCSAEKSEKTKILESVKTEVVRLEKPASSGSVPKMLAAPAVLKSASAEIAALSSKKYLFVYFSAHWCPPCRKFTPELVNFYNENVKNGDFDLIFVSADDDREGMLTYMQETKMPWFAVPPKGTAAEALAKKFGVTVIPYLVLLGKDGAVLSSGQFEPIQEYLKLHPEPKK